MKKKTFPLLAGALAILACLASCAPKTQEIKLISYNIRLGVADDGENSWNFRKQATANMLNTEKPDAFGLQEAMSMQLEFIEENFPQYKRVGVGRDDGVAEGECMAIFYDTGKFELLESTTYWLSETPEKVSFGWDAACRRTVTMTHLKSKETGKDLCFFNTHLDHRGPVARAESVKLLQRLMDEFADNGTPVVLCGDMNSHITPIFDPLFADGFVSARDIAAITDSHNTYNAWGEYDGQEGNEGMMVIDHFFTKGIIPKSFRTLTQDYGAPYISDHYPIELTFDL